MTVLIPGAGGGIGNYLAQELYAQHHKVYGTYNRSAISHDSCALLSKVDVTDENQVKLWIDSLDLTSDKEIALVNCVGTNFNAALHKSDTLRWEEVIKTNLTGSYFLLRNIIPYMREHKFGRIILMSSVVPLIGVSGTSAYSASKSALWGLTKSVASENAKLGITANTLNLGYFDLGMIHDVPDKTLEQIVNRIPVAGLGSPDNILNAVNFLLKSDYITGSQINLNGGIY